MNGVLSDLVPPVTAPGYRYLWVNRCFPRALDLAGCTSMQLRLVGKTSLAPLVVLIWNPDTNCYYYYQFF